MSLGPAVPFEALHQIRTKHLTTLWLTAGEMLPVGDTPVAHRNVGLVAAGYFEGERFSGEVLPGGSDWQQLRSDGVVPVDVRLHLKTSNGALVLMRYEGLRHGPPETIRRLAAGEAVGPSEYYFRLALLLETASDKYAWLNRTLVIGTGQRLPQSPVYSLFEVL